MAAPAGDLAIALQGVLARITRASAAQRPTRLPVRLVAVSKTKPMAAVMEAYDAGQRHFGENYVQEMEEKSPHAPNDLKWHFIGHLQSNKVKKLLASKNLWMIETVDSDKLAREIDKQLRKLVEEAKTTPLHLEVPLRVLVQVNTSNEEAKSGCEPSECVNLVSYIVKNCRNLKFSGLMTIGRLAGDPTPDFELLAKCKDDVSAQLGIPADEIELSMGMSGDFEKAISLGSTNVRVGSTIFGERHYPAKAANAASQANPTEESH